MRKVYCDSSTTQACVVFEGESPRLFEYEELLTCNLGEYRAVLFALDLIINRGVDRELKGCQILSDSQLVVNQVRGHFKCNNPKLKPYRDLVRMNLPLAVATLEWIPREENLAGKVLE